MWRNRSATSGSMWRNVRDVIRPPTPAFVPVFVPVFVGVFVPVFVGVFVRLFVPVFLWLFV